MSFFKVRDKYANNNLVQVKLQEAAKKTASHDTVVVSDDIELPIDKSVSLLMLSIVGGGGCGGNASTKGTFEYCGGGGGSGGGCVKKPITIQHTDKQETRVKVNIGKGGTFETHDGGNTVVYIYNGDKVVSKYIGHGGKGALGKLNKGGEGGLGNAETNPGSVGNNGSLIFVGKTAPTFGGNGADSLFSKGGLGGKQEYLTNDTENDFQYPSNKDNPKGLDGEKGSGGGGSCSENEQDVTKGGDGFAILEF